MSNPKNEPETEPTNPEALPVEQGDIESIERPAQPKPPREISQAAIASFFYGTLQLLLTSVGSVMILIMGQTMKTFQSSVSSPTGLTGLTGTGETPTAEQLAEMQKMMEELGITDPSATPIDPYVMPPVDPTIGPTLDTPNPPDITSFFPTYTSTNSQIVPMEFLFILVTHGFGLLALITAFVAFGAVEKGKSGRGLAITGLISGFISFSIAFMIALEM